MAEPSTFFTAAVSLVDISNQQFEETSSAFDGISASTLSSRGYDVFINHRGPDVKKTLASSIYHWLQPTGLRVFFDTEEFQTGEQLQQAIAEAIRTASVHIAIFSKGYAKSSWCLNELSFMLKSGAKIIPVFYDVEPSDLRRVERGVYADAFVQYEKKYGYKPHQLEEWKNALRKVADYSGLELKNDQGKLLKCIVENVQRNVKRVRLEVGNDPVGLDEAVECFENFLAEQNDHTIKTVGIVGLEGSGKTTLANEFYNRKSMLFERSSFLSGVREASAKNALQSLQCQLLRELVLIDRVINNTSEGKGMLREYLRSRRVLIVIDDIDHTDQLDALSVLKLSGISLQYGVKALEPKHAQELLCRHAFHRPHPVNGFEDIIQRVLIKCGGLPSLVKSIGRHLCLYGNNNIVNWEDELEIISEKSHSILKGEYDALNEEEKEMFLDIACFFVGEDKNLTVRIWNGLERRVSHCLQTLMDKCLIDVDNQNRLQMHGHLQDFGREIANGQFPNSRLWLPDQAANILKRWEGSLEVRGILAATTQLRTSYPYCASYFQPPFEQIQRLRDQSMNTVSVGLKLLVIQGDCFNREFSNLSRDLLWLRWFECPLTSIHQWLSLENLRVLELIDGNLQELWLDYEQKITSPSLNSILGSFAAKGAEYYRKQATEKTPRVDNITETPGKDNFGWSQLYPNSARRNLLPAIAKTPGAKGLQEFSIQPEMLGKMGSLRLLDLVDTTLQGSPNELQNLSNLQVLRIGSPFLVSLPNLPSLTQLFLKDCAELKGQLNLSANASVKESEIMYFAEGEEQLSNLKTLFVHNCPISELKFTNLVEGSTPQDQWKRQGWGCMNRLKSIELYKTKLTKMSLPEDAFPNLACLILSDNIHLMEVESLPTTLLTLSLNECEVLKRISGISHLTKLQMLNINGCKELAELPSVAQLSSLSRLEAAGCHMLQIIEGLEHLTNLRHLNISDCHQLDNLASLKHLRSLKNLIISGCFKLESIECLAHLTSLETLQAVGCRKLQTVKGLECMTKLQQINISNCDRVADLPSLAHLSSLKNLTINGCGKLSSVEGMASLTSLETLEASRCWKLKSIKGLEHLAKLQQLNIGHCCTLNKLPCLQLLSSLQKLIINGCVKLQLIEGLANLKSLEFLETGGCWKLQNLEGLDKLSKLQQLNISHCNQLVELPSLVFMKSLKILIISGCRKLRKIDGLPDLRSLETLEAGGCWKLQSIEGVGRLENLQRLNINHCNELGQELPNLARLSSLKYLIIKGCTKLQSIGGLANLISLEKLEAGGCWKLQSINGLENLENLQQLDISHCCEIEQVPNLARLTSLNKLMINGCVKIQNIQGMANLECLESLQVGSHSKLQSIVGLGYLAQLQQLSISQFYELYRLECLPRLSSLQNLTLNACPKLHSIQGLAQLRCLETLEASCCGKLQSLEGLHRLTKLRQLRISHCCELEEFPSVAGLSSLKKLTIKCCVKLQRIQGLSNLRSLESFDVGGCTQLGSVEGVEQLTNLQELDLSCCYKLHELPSLKHLSLLQRFIINGCRKLEGLKGLARLRSLQIFKSSGCRKLQSVEGLEHLECLKELQLSTDSRVTLQRLPSTMNLSRKAVPGVETILASVNFRTVFVIDSVKGGGGMYNIHSDYWEVKTNGGTSWSTLILCFLVENEEEEEEERICMSMFRQGCRILKRVKHGERVKIRREWWDEGVDVHRSSIKKGWIVTVSEGEEGKILQALNKIFKIDIQPEMVGKMGSLRLLDLVDTTLQGSLHELQNLKPKGQLNLSANASVKESEIVYLAEGEEKLIISHLTKLQMLNINGCKELTELPSVVQLSSLSRVEASGYQMLQSIEGLEHLTNIRHLNISDCHQLDNMPSLSHLRSLKNLIINDCFKLESIECLAHLTYLETLQAVGCRKLRSVKGLESLTKLQQKHQ
eukprot:Gb_03865 [translate_table: standard]